MTAPIAAGQHAEETYTAPYDMSGVLPPAASFAGSSDAASPTAHTLANVALDKKFEGNKTSVTDTDFPSAIEPLLPTPCGGRLVAGSEEEGILVDEERDDDGWSEVEA